MVYYRGLLALLSFGMASRARNKCLGRALVRRRHPAVRGCVRVSVRRPDP